MPKSYKVTFYRVFEKSSFQEQPLTLNRQLSIDENPPIPQTRIYKSRDQINLKDFERFLIEHEMEEVAFGRYGDSIFHKYIRKEYINGFQSPSMNMLLLSGKKRFVLDFCKKTKDWPHIKLNLINIDMGRLLEKLPHVKGVWFNFKNGLIRASALMGANIESTNDFQKYQTEGEISTLSFHYEYGDVKHPVMLVSDGTVVLQSAYKEVSDELELVLDIKSNLIDDIHSLVPI